MLTGVLTPDATRLVALPAAAGALRFGGMLDARRRVRAACAFVEQAICEVDSESSILAGCVEDDRTRVAGVWWKVV